MDVEAAGTQGSNDLSDSQIDSLLEGGGGSRDIPMKGAPEPQAAQEYTLTVNGKEVRAPLDKVLQWAQMGYNYPQRAQELNAQQQQFLKERQEWEARQKEFESKWSPYKEVDEYASKNPDWWQQVQEQYKQKIAEAETNPEIKALKDELAEIKRFKDEITTEKRTLQQQQEDQQLAGEIESIRKSFPNLDFDTPDEAGKSLEMKVIEHAVSNDIKSFRVAFRDFYHDHLLSKAREEGKEVLSKDIQKQAKSGVLGVTQKPTKGIRPAESVKDKSYEALMREALEELNSN